MGFYHPLTLGTRRSRMPRSDVEKTGEPETKRTPYDSWREGAQRLAHEYDEHPGAEVLEELRRTGRGGRFWLVLGEPGAGKSTLLGEWFRDWAGQLGAPRAGMTVPVLVPLRSLEAADAKRDFEGLADRLWELGLGSRALLDGRCEAIYRSDLVRAFTPAWLLDGLDELPPALVNETLFRSVVNLPGTKLVTCRTAVYEPLRTVAGRYQEAGREYDILGLGSEAQLEFLAGALHGHQEEAARLHEAIQRNGAIRPLAANPLMLTLLVRVASSERLPATRAGFYRDAVREMWYRRVGYRPDAAELAEVRDAVLTRLAGRMQMDKVEGELAWLLEAARGSSGDDPHTVVTLLQQTGLLRVDLRREVFSLAHLTFQEYYLARFLRDSALDRLLEDLWKLPLYEETLALLVSECAGEGRGTEVGSAVRRLVEHQEEIHRSDPQSLRKVRRSPLRTMLHVLGRSGIPLDTSGAGSLWTWLWADVASSPARAFAVASDAYVPPEVLAHLALHPSEDVRWSVAENPGTSPETLLRLAQDSSEVVRSSVAESQKVPAEGLLRLAHDPSPSVRCSVGENLSTPMGAVLLLAGDPDEYVRTNVARNPGTPAWALLHLARDPDEGVRWTVESRLSESSEALASPAEDPDEDAATSVAADTATPTHVLLRLAEDPDREVRAEVARNPAAPPEALIRLARDAARSVRWGVAGNPSTPPEALVRLAEDQDERVRWYTAENPGSPAEALMHLAQSPDRSLRWRVARNPGAPAEVLLLLSRDLDKDIRRSVARNPGTPSEALLHLAQDPEQTVRKMVSRHPGTPPEALLHFGRDSDKILRATAAEHPGTPAEVLLLLAEDPELFVRRRTASNPSTPAEALLRLAQDPAADVRWSVAENPGTPGEALLRLAQDTDLKVRRAAASNQALLLEDL